MAGAHDPVRIRLRGSPRVGGWPSALSGLGMTAGGLIARATAGLVGLAVVVGVVAPQSEADARARLQQGAQSPPTNTITLKVPEGELAGHLTVVDESGRELATVTRWSGGAVDFVARTSGGAGVCCWLNEVKGTARLNLTGSARQTLIDVQPDGRAERLRGEVHEAPPTPERPSRAKSAVLPARPA